jgi:hypothetical protein
MPFRWEALKNAAQDLGLVPRFTVTQDLSEAIPSCAGVLIRIDVEIAVCRIEVGMALVGEAICVASTQVTFE